MVSNLLFIIKSTNNLYSKIQLGKVLFTNNNNNNSLKPHFIRHFNINELYFFYFRIQTVHSKRNSMLSMELL